MNGKMWPHYSKAIFQVVETAYTQTENMDLGVR